MGLELEEGVFVNRVTPDVERVAHMVAHPVPEQTDLRELFGRAECCQLCFYFDAQTQRRVMAELPTLVASRWCPIFADVNVAGIDKAKFRRQVVPGDVLDLEVEIIAQRGPVGVGKAIASVEGKRAVTCEIKFAVEQ